MGDEVDFLSADKHESSLQVCIAWHAQRPKTANLQNPWNTSEET